MEIWEVVKVLSENKDLIFVCGRQPDNPIGVVDDVLCWVNTKDPFEFNFRNAELVGTIDVYDWELMPKEVSWQEAISAWLDGKAVVCKCNGGGTVVFSSGGINMALYVDKEKLKYGKWYIKS